MPQNILIYANKVARRSETFIYFPALAMQRYTPYFVGSRREHSFDLPRERVFIANGEGLAGQIQQKAKSWLFGHNGVPHLVGQLRRYQPCLLQAHFGPESINALPLAERLGIPFLIYYHGFDATMTEAYARQNAFLRRYLAKLPRLHAAATLVLTQSDFLRRRVIEWGYPAHKVRTHYIGVAAPSEPPLPLEKREPYVLFAARLVEKKGAVYLIQAMQMVQQRYPELELVIVGDGELRPELEAQAQNQLRKYRFVGWQTPQQVTDWMRHARIFCVPSITAANGDAEGFGMVFIEAQRVGTPVVSTLHGGIVESVADGVTGLLVSEKDSAGLASSIERLYTDNTLWQQFSQATVERVRQHFNLHKLVSQLEDIYDEILSSK